MDVSNLADHLCDLLGMLAVPAIRVAYTGRIYDGHTGTARISQPMAGDPSSLICMRGHVMANTKLWSGKIQQTILTGTLPRHVSKQPGTQISM